jgi:uroporphyrinogen-III decarboxylase
VDPVQGEEDLPLLKKELGDVKTLMGGINGDVFLANASSPQIDNCVRQTLELMSSGSGFILHVIPGVYAGIPWGNVLNLAQAWKRYA